ncbi:hypothetical protein ACIRRA_45015 [Nocardia sp. NPDC101769]|uniref:hypothetical protein n=1 Tax=Nocardia sp. NPDC101769 TaxID=3364333 RepID=UPI003815C2A5
MGLRAELSVRGVRHCAGGDVVSVHVGGLRFDVLAWHGDDGEFMWLVDHPRADPFGDPLAAGYRLTG